MAVDPQVAPVWRRMCAGVVDAAIGSAAIGAVIGLPVLREVIAGDRDARAMFAGRWRAVFGEDKAARRRSDQIGLVEHLARVLLDERVTPGQRLLGVRWASVEKGGPVGWRQMLVKELLELGKERLIRLANRARRDRILEVHAMIRRRNEELEQEHAGDPEALRHARTAAGQELQSGWARSIAASCALGLIEPLTVFLSPRRQSLIERASGLVVVRTRE